VIERRKKKKETEEEKEEKEGREGEKKEKEKISLLNEEKGLYFVGNLDTGYDFMDEVRVCFLSYSVYVGFWFCLFVLDNFHRLLVWILAKLSCSKRQQRRGNLFG
jgi:hypothetical protein